MIATIVEALLEALLGTGVFILGTLLLTVAIEAVKRAHSDTHPNR